MSSNSNRWRVTIEDAGNDEAIIPLPDELLEQLGWKEGDTINVEPLPEGGLIISKVETDTSTSPTHDKPAGGAILVKKGQTP